jgi:large subunit ribosomal protein L3
MQRLSEQRTRRQTRARCARTAQAAALEPGVGVFGNKAGMTQIFEDGGSTCTPVTVIKFEGTGNVVTQRRRRPEDGYNALQLGYGDAKPGRLTKPEQGHLNKAGAPPLSHLEEFRLRYTRQVDEYSVGDIIDPPSLFQCGDVVDVQGSTIGRGFQGAIKRWNHSRGPESHGSKNVREQGTMGGRTPKRCVPGRQQAGRMGNRTVKQQRLVVKSIASDHMVVKGNVPGKAGNLLRITPAKIIGYTVRG